MPGTFTSMPKSGRPLTIDGPSMLFIGWPMSLYSLGSLKVTEAGSGGASVAALAPSATCCPRRPAARISPRRCPLLDADALPVDVQLLGQDRREGRPGRRDHPGRLVNRLADADVRGTAAQVAAPKKSS